MSRKKRIGALTEVHFSMNIIIKRNLKAYREVRQLILLQTETGFTRQSAEIITTCDTTDILNSQI